MKVGKYSWVPLNVMFRFTTTVEGDKNRAKIYDFYNTLKNALNAFLSFISEHSATYILTFYLKASFTLDTISQTLKLLLNEISDNFEDEN